MAFNSWEINYVGGGCPKSMKYLPQGSLDQNRKVRKALKYNYLTLRTLRNLDVHCVKKNFFNALYFFD